MTAALILTLIVFFLAACWLFPRRLAQAREAYIQTSPLPKGIFAKVIRRHPHLTDEDMELVSRGLRQFFMAYLKSGKKHVSMPSQVADDLWHEFILYTKNYQEFTRRSFGGFLHHTPAVVLSAASGHGNIGLRRCWRYACLEENINPHSPSRLPLLFVLDTKLGIANGFRYQANCKGVKPQSEGSTGTVYCGGDFSNNMIYDSALDIDDDFGVHHFVDHGAGSDGHGEGHGSGSDGCGGGGDSD